MYLEFLSTCIKIDFCFIVLQCIYVYNIMIVYI